MNLSRRRALSTTKRSFPVVIPSLSPPFASAGGGDFFLYQTEDSPDMRLSSRTKRGIFFWLKARFLTPFGITPGREFFRKKPKRVRLPCEVDNQELRNEDGFALRQVFPFVTACVIFPYASFITEILTTPSHGSYLVACFGFPSERQGPL